MTRLEDIFGERLLRDEPLAKHVNFRLGGPAKFYLVAESSEDIIEAVRAAKVDGIDFVMLGGGTNVLPHDKGHEGLVIQAANRDWKIDGTSVVAEAGVPMSLLARKTAEAGLTGLEWAVSLPGTVGGAVRGNAGCFGGETKDHLVEAVTLHVDGTEVRTEKLSNKDLAFGYRESKIKHSDDLVLGARFELEEADKETCLARIEEVLSKRKADQPAGAKTAGCMFKNFEYEEDSDIAKLKGVVGEIPEKFLEAKRIPAGWLIDRHDLKGKKIGGASVSEDHANFLVNDGTATASDVIQLMSFIKMKIRDDYGIQLMEEVQYLGF